jgi:serine/threonine protein kinase
VCGVCNCADVGTGLEYLHASNIVHRDIKPDNILVGADGAAMLTDFGLSEQVVESVTTRAGTPHHMAPEVVKRESTTIASDVWSFGVTVIDLFDGQPPHAEMDVEAVMEAVVSSPPPRTIRPSSAALSAFIAAALHKQPEKRLTASQLLKLDVRSVLFTIVVFCV